MGNSSTSSFWKFLNEHTIKIPIIQRDYAQGRVGKEGLRVRFLKDLRSALKTNSPMTLDFTYGDFDSKTQTFYPLDGQQRLTTLWLIHWYIAYKANKLADAKNILQKFSYETRSSSRDFCWNLCELPALPSPSQSEKQKSLEEHIKNQTWFFSSWENDPTIQSMLRMLSGTCDKDGIQLVFDGLDYIHLWECLTSDNKSPWIFRYLDIQEIKQTDDLYVKMNSRGKPLSSFENFKAELFDYIHQHATDSHENTEKANWIKLDNITDGFAQQFETSWIDIFWTMRSNDECERHEHLRNKVDEIIFAFFNRYYYNENFASNFGSTANSQCQKLYGNRSNDTRNVFTSLDDYKFYNGQITLESFNRLTAFFNNFKVYFKQRKLDEYKNDINPKWDSAKKFSFIPEYKKYMIDGENLLNNDYYDDDNNQILEIINIATKERCIFYAICRFFEINAPKEKLQYSDDIIYSDTQITRFRDWMRFVWNIVENGDDNLSGAINLVKELSAQSHDILSFLSNCLAEDGEIIKDGNIYFIKSDYASDQLKEECEKARQILDDNGNERQSEANGKSWYERIMEAEQYAFFHGCIRFLYRDNIRHLLWESFNIKFENAKKYFSPSGVKEAYSNNAFLIRALLSKIESWKDFLYWKMTNVNNNACWLAILKNDSLLHAVHSLLLNEVSQESIKSPVLSGITPQQQNAINDLINTSLLTKVKEGVELRQDDGVYCFLKQRTRGDSTYYVIGHERNRILTSNSINANAKVYYTSDDGTKYYMGWNVGFDYNGKCYSYGYDGHIRRYENGNLKEEYDSWDTFQKGNA